MAFLFTLMLSYGRNAPFGAPMLSRPKISITDAIIISPYSHITVTAVRRKASFGRSLRGSEIDENASSF